MWWVVRLSLREDDLGQRRDGAAGGSCAGTRGKGTRSGRWHCQCEALSQDQVGMLQISKESPRAGAELGPLRADEVLEVTEDQVM